MRGLLILLGLLLVAGGGAVAGAQYANLDIPALDSVAGARAFLFSPMSIYVGAGAAVFGLLLIIIAAATGGRKPKRANRPIETPREPEQPAKPQEPLTPDNLFDPDPPPAPEAPRTVIRPPEQSQTASAKPTASAHPPAGYDPAEAARIDPRLLNRRRVTDLVSINDALKAYHAQHRAYPKADGLAGFAERGEDWIPGLAPEFIARLPRDPLTGSGQPGPQYVYASDGKNYKLLAQGVSLIGGTHVEVLGVRIDPTRNPTADNAAFGFWTPDFASA